MSNIRRLRMTMKADRLNQRGDRTTDGFNEFTTAEPDKFDIATRIHTLMELYRLRCAALNEEPDWASARIDVTFDTWRP